MQVLTYGEREPVAQLMRRIESTTPADIKRVARDMLRHPPSVAAFGDLQNLSPYSTIRSWMG